MDCMRGTLRATTAVFVLVVLLSLSTTATTYSTLGHWYRTKHAQIHPATPKPVHSIAKEVTPKATEKSDKKPTPTPHTQATEPQSSAPTLHKAWTCEDRNSATECAKEREDIAIVECRDEARSRYRALHAPGISDDAEKAAYATWQSEMAVCGKPSYSQVIVPAVAEKTTVPPNETVSESERDRLFEAASQKCNDEYQVLGKQLRDLGCEIGCFDASLGTYNATEPEWSRLNNLMWMKKRECLRIFDQHASVLS